MRLINAEVLKEKWKEECCGCCENCSHCMTGLNCELIDNAPTVEQSDFKAGYKQAILDGKTQYQKPQGEWKYKQEYDYEYWECSNCGEPWDLLEGTPKNNNMNFCPNCGADMREESDK